MNTQKEFIETEAALIAALSQQGRFLDADFDDEEDSLDIRLKWQIMETPDGKYTDKIVALVDADLAKQWTDDNEAIASVTPWCSTFALPAFWPWKEPD